MPQTGHGQNLITKNTIGSYNTAVAQINKHQKENVDKLNRALSVANENNSRLSTQIELLNNDLKDLKYQTFVNQVLIDNWDINNTANYVFDTSLLD